MDFNRSEEDVFLRTATKNSKTFLKVYGNGDIETFLKREQYLPLRACKTSELLHQSCIEFIPDIDGLVLEHQNISGVSIPIRYFNLLPKGKLSLIPIYHTIKKHLPLFNYTKEGLAILKESLGIQLFSDHGWQFIISLVPCEKFTSNIIPSTYRELVLNFFVGIKERISQHLKGINNPTDLNRETVKKNKLSDVSMWTVSPGDQDWYMGLLDNHLNASNIPKDFEIFLYSARFGERERDPINLNYYVDLRTVKRISVHAAVTVDMSPIKVNAMWSKDGLYPLIGNRGQIWKTLTFSESINFQSNLDGRRLSVDPSLKKIANHPETVQFVQFYVDTPHLYPRSKINNPVTGCIATTGLLHHKTVDLINKSAQDYITVMDENSRKICFPLRSRVEIVCLTSIIPHIINASDYLDSEHLSSLMNEYPIVIPMAENVMWYSDIPLTHALKDVCLNLTENLRQVFDQHKGYGGFSASWKCFQLECALEFIFYGKTLCCLSRQTANLLTSCRLGFLTLDEPNSTVTSENDTPPVKIWTQSAEQIERITRAFKFTNYLHCSSPVLGKEVILLLLIDLIHNRSFMQLTLDDSVVITSLKGETKPRWAQCVGLLTRGAIAENILKGTYRYPLVFGRILEILRSKDLDAKNLITQGIKELRLKYFPALRFTDKSRNEKCHWTGRTVWSVIHSTGRSYDVRRLTKEIATELAAKELIFESKLAYIFNDENIIFPWIEPVIKRLEGLPIDDNDQKDILVLTSCLSFLMAGLYVNYEKIRYVRVPISISQLQERNILSHSTFGSRLKRMYKLHEDIEWKIDVPVYKTNKVQKTQHETTVEPVADIPFQDLDEVEQIIHPEPVVHRSANFNGRWTVDELEIVDELLRHQLASDRRWKKLYEEYSRICKDRNIPDRSYKAFKDKITCISKAKK